jgi:hypothetical protein
MKFQDVEALCNALEQANAEAVYEDGLVTFPAHLLESMHNAMFPKDQRHEYTETVQES